MSTPVTRRTRGTATVNVSPTAEAIRTNVNLYLPDPPAADPAVHTLLKPLTVTANKNLLVKMKDPKGLGGLLGRPPKLGNAGTAMMDGRMQPVALVVLRDKKGATKKGVELQLLDKAGGTLLDLSRTDINGVVLLRFPMSGSTRNNPTPGVVQLADGSKSVSFNIPPAPTQHAVVPFLLDDVTALAGAGNASDLPPDNPLTRLPRDFTTDLCNAVSAVIPTVPD